MRFILVFLVFGFPAYAGGLVKEGLDDPHVADPVRCWLIPGLIPCHTPQNGPLVAGCPPNDGGPPVSYTPPDGPIDDPHDPMNPPTDRPSRQNNGLGNGDQTAPGNSRETNRAENQRGNPGHRSGKAQNSN